MGLIKCVVPGCEDRSSPRHRIPVLDQELYEEWLKRIGNEDLCNLDPEFVGTNKRVCSVHFSSHCRVPNSTKLKKRSLPTLHLPVFKEEPSEKNSILKYPYQPETIARKELVRYIKDYNPEDDDEKKSDSSFYSVHSVASPISKSLPVDPPGSPHSRLPSVDLLASPLSNESSINTLESPLSNLSSIDPLASPLSSSPFVDTLASPLSILPKSPSITDSSLKQQDLGAMFDTLANFATKAGVCQPDFRCDYEDQVRPDPVGVDFNSIEPDYEFHSTYIDFTYLVYLSLLDSPLIKESQPPRKSSTSARRQNTHRRVAAGRGWLKICPENTSEVETETTKQ